MRRPLRITILGLSITSSWGNGHATTYRSLIRGLVNRGHSVLFLERNVPWYAKHRDRLGPSCGRVQLYDDLDELSRTYRESIRTSDCVMVGSYVPDGIDVGNWVCDTSQGITAFYDIDTPVTLKKLTGGDDEYINPALVGRFDCYLSFTGGNAPRLIEQEFGSPFARPLYCSVDPRLYRPESVEPIYDLGYLGTYSDDRQPPLDKLMLEAARGWSRGRFLVAGPQYPSEVDWPKNVRHVEHLPPAEHCRFYNSQRATMNVTRAEMVRSGYAPSVRLFEAAACGTPIISDWWDGLDTFFRPGREILITRSADDTLRYLREMDDESLKEVATAARKRVLAEHTGDRRAEQLETILKEAAVAKHSRGRARRPNRMAAPRRSAFPG